MQEMLKVACGLVFSATWWVCIAALLYTVIEVIAVATFVPFVFSTGKVLVRITEPLIVRTAALPPKGSTPHATFRLIDPKQCLFREWGPGLVFPRIAVPFFLKGTIHLRGGEAFVLGRAALGPSVLLVAFLTAWAVGALGVLLQDGWRAAEEVFLFLAIGWGILGFTAVYLARRAKRRFLQSYQEVRAALQPTIWL